MWFDPGPDSMYALPGRVRESVGAGLRIECPVDGKVRNRNVGKEESEMYNVCCICVLCVCVYLFCFCLLFIVFLFLFLSFSVRGLNVLYRWKHRNVGKEWE